MKRLFIFTLIALFGLTMFSETLVLRNGKTINGKVVGYTNDSIILENGKKYSINDVRDLIFAKMDQGSKTTKSVKASKLKKWEYNKFKKLFDIAKDKLEKFPSVKYVQLWDMGSHTLKYNGPTVYQYHFLAYVNSYEGVQDLSKKELYYGSTTYKTELLMGRVIYPDGTVYNVDPKDFQVVKPQSEGWSYGGGKRKVYSFPNIKKGVLVEFIARYTNLKPDNPKLFESGYAFQGDIPVYKSTFTMTLPKTLVLNKKVERRNVKFNYITRNMPKGTAKPKIKITKYNRIYFWEVNNMPPFIKEPYAVNEEDLVPNIQGTILQKRSELDSWVGKMEQERMIVTPVVEQTLKSILNTPSPKDTKLNKTEINLAKIYHWVQTNINYLSVKGSVSSGLSGHPAEETIKNGKGDCIDKAIVMATLAMALKDPNLIVYPVTVKANDSEKQIVEIPVIDGNHAISEVHLKNAKTGEWKIFYLDGTASSYRYPYFRGDDKGITAVNEILGTVRMIPVPKPEKEKNFYTIEASINKKGVITGHTRGDYNGDYEARLRNLYMYRKGDNERRQIFGNMVNGMSPKGELTDYKLSDAFDYFHPFVLQYSYKLYDFPTITKNFVITTLPGVDYSFPEYQLNKRTTPIEYNSSRFTGHKVTITIPKGYKIEFLPHEIDLKSDEVHYSAHYTYKDGKIYFEDSYKRYNRIIVQNNYLQNLDIHKQILNYVKEPIVLRKK
ncbi:DUF3857 and transglutaminase domain-containing protein [bacterium]|nr:DUF3857 and transglutaminase domain-containing protein [bacterium]